MVNDSKKSQGGWLWINRQDVSFLTVANLSAIETNLVLTGVDYIEGENKQNLLEQMQCALKKFIG